MAGKKLKQERCPICGNDETTIFFRWENAVVHQQILMPTIQQAKQAKRGDIILAFCNVCGLIWNTAFKSQLLDYSGSYEASQSLSPSFQRYVTDIAKYLVEKYNLHSKEILEIGSGDGFLLNFLCQLGNNQGVGFDPSWRDSGESNIPESVTYIADYYSPRYAHYQGDLLCCRHVLEHIPEPVGFLKDLARLTQSRLPVFFFEVPNAPWSLHQSAFWDIYYEHCLYFSRVSLRYLFIACGFDILDIKEGFGGQYVWVEARFQPEKPKLSDDSVSKKEADRLAREVEAFSTEYQQAVEKWREQVTQSVMRQRVVIWGAGAKGVSFLNILNIQPEQIEFVADINPQKHGTYVPGTGQRIVAPEYLTEYKPDVIMVMNPEYLSEIRDILDKMKVKAKLLAVGTMVKEHELELSKMAVSKPLVSIGMPVYNAERYLRQALNSLLAQDYRNFELIISDNASTDGTQKICLKYAARDKRVRYYRNRTNRGAIWNYNRVFELSSGEYFMWAAHDDYWDPRYLRSCLEAFGRSKAIVLAGTLCQDVDRETGETIRTFPGLSTIGLSPRARFMRVGSMYSGNRHPAGIFYGVYKRNALRKVMPLKKELVVEELLLLPLSLRGELVTVQEKLMVKRARVVTHGRQETARSLGISNQLHIWCSSSVREVMWLRIIFQSDRLGWQEKVMLACWSLIKYAQFSIHHGPLTFWGYRILLALWPGAARRARELWLSKTRGA